MEETYELLVNIIIPALVTTLLGLAVPALNEKRKQLKAGKNKLLIDILETAIHTALDYFRNQNKTPTVEGVKDYVETSIPDTIAEINPKATALEKKIVGEAAKRAIDILR